MRIIAQRVTSSKVIVEEETIGIIGKGLNLLIGFSKDDNIDDLNYCADKVLNLRIFSDDEEKMNLSLMDIKGEVLAISQFTLYGDCRKGRRPNFMNAMGGDKAEELYLEFISILRKSGLKIECGKFGADMKVDIQNDGPVTIMIDSKKCF